MLKRYRFRAYPTPGQTNRLARVFGCCRVVWNDALAARENARKAGLKPPTRAELSVALTQSKRTPERVWLGEVSAVPLQQALADLDRAYAAFFNSLSGTRRGRRVGAPRFKKKQGYQSARFTNNAGFKVKTTTHGVGFVTLPKIGKVRYEASRPLPAVPSSVTILREPDGRYYASFVVDVPAVEPLPTIDRVAGVDLGLTDLAAITYSDGTREKITNPRWERTRARKLARAQRALARKERGSRNRAKARVKVAVEHRKTREARADHLHKLALRLVRENQTVAVETLSVNGLARTRMARSIHDVGWGMFLRVLREKADTYGRAVIGISRFEPTTQTCSNCGRRDGKKPLNVRTWTCPECGTRLDRDYNAAVNIMVAAGLAETLNACGGSIRLRLAEADPTKQEPTKQTRNTPFQAA